MLDAIDKAGFPKAKEADAVPGNGWTPWISTAILIPLRYIQPDFVNVLGLSKEENMYAYDAYFLDCAMRHKAPLLTLDKKLITTAHSLKIEIMGV